MRFFPLLPHKKIKEGRFDEELYKHKSQIYIALALQFGKDLNSCELLSLVGQMLAMAADRSMIKLPKRQSDNKVLLKNARYHERKIREIGAYLQKKRERILGDYHLLSRKDLVEMGIQKTDLKLLDKHTDIYKKKIKDARDVHTKLKIESAEELHRKLNKAIRCGDSKMFSQVIKKKERSMTGTTNKLIYKGQTYLNKDVLKGFAEKARDESEDPMTTEGVEITREYLDMRNAAMNAIRSADYDDTMIRPLTRESFKDLLKEIPKGKALDSMGLSIEHILYADQTVIDLIMELLNTVISDLDWASHPLINLGIATMLYKEKGKPLDDPTSFRRIQVSRFI